jgi:hypothetical protein
MSAKRQEVASFADRGARFLWSFLFRAEKKGQSPHARQGAPPPAWGAMRTGWRILRRPSCQRPRTPIDEPPAQREVKTHLTPRPRKKITNKTLAKPRFFPTIPEAGRKEKQIRNVVTIENDNQ